MKAMHWGIVAVVVVGVIGLLQLFQREEQAEVQQTNRTTAETPKETAVITQERAETPTLQREVPTPGENKAHKLTNVTAGVIGGMPIDVLATNIEALVSENREAVLEALGEMAGNPLSAERMRLILATLIRQGPEELVIGDLSTVSEELYEALVESSESPMDVSGNWLVPPGPTALGIELGFFLLRPDVDDGMRTSYEDVLCDWSVDSPGGGLFLTLALGAIAKDMPEETKAKLKELAAYPDEYVFPNVALVNYGRVASVSELSALVRNENLTAGQTDSATVRRISGVLSAMANARNSGDDAGDIAYVQLTSSALKNWRGTEQLESKRSSLLMQLRYTRLPEGIRGALDDMLREEDLSPRLRGQAEGLIEKLNR